MRAERLVALLFLLQQRQRATAAELAAALEVSERTVYRDVEALLAAGVPLWTEQGRAGGIRLLEGWRTRLDGLTGREAAAIFAMPSLLADVGLGSALSAAQAKVSAGLPAELREYASRVASLFHLDAPGWFQEVESASQLTVVAEAVASSRRLRMEYRRGATVTRELDPFGLVVKAGVWYLVGRVDADIRTYRVAKIVSAEVLSDSFSRPADFVLASWWEEASARFERSLLRETVRLRLSRRALKLLRSVTDADAAAMAVATAGPADAEGWREVSLEVESLPVATTQLLSLGVGVEVVAPEALRASLAELGLAIAARNAPVEDRHESDAPDGSA